MMPPAPTLSPEAKYRLLLKLSQEIGRSLDLQEVLAYLLESVRTAAYYQRDLPFSLEAITRA